MNRKKFIEELAFLLQDIEDAEEAANNSDSEEKSTEEGLFDMVGYFVCYIFF